MRSSLFFALAFGTAALAGCMPVSYPAPPAPQKTLPDIEMPSEPPAEGMGRVVVDVAGQQARVARVVRTPVTNPSTTNGERSLYGRSFLVRNDELLCISPCVLDLAQGAHELSFTSIADDARTSTAEIVVSTQPTAVRHSLGYEKGASYAYAGGFLLTLVGGMLVTFGAASTTVGLVTNSDHPSETERATAAANHTSSGTIITMGLVSLGVGLLTGAGGIALMNNNRPEHQPGTTTYWPIKSRSTDDGISANR